MFVFKKYKHGSQPVSSELKFDLYNNFSFRNLSLGFVITVTKRYNKTNEIFFTFYRIFVFFLIYNNDCRFHWLWNFAQLNF